MRVDLRDGWPTVNGAPAGVIARRWEPAGGRLAVRAAARRMADAGWRAAWVAGEADEDARDAARRAGLTIVCDTGPSAPGLVRSDDLAPGVLATVDSVDAAWFAWLAGARVVRGPESAVVGLQRVLDLAPTVVVLERLEPRGAWQLAGRAGELLGYASDGEPVEFAIPAREPAWAVHWLRPDSGRIEAMETPEPGERHRLQPWRGEPAAFYLGPPAPADPAALEPTVPDD